MREILFRGKRIDNGEWAYGSLHIEWGETRKDGSRNKDYRILGMRGECYYVDPNTIGQYAVDPATVGQYTDMNIYGERIFEGDILKLDYIGEGRGVQGVAEVAFQNGKFGLLWGYRKELVPLDGFANVKMEIIGNIHDNPELLGGGE